MMGRRPLTAAEIAVGVAMTVAALAHVAAHVLAGRYFNVLWICNVVALLLGPALLLRSAVLSAVCLTWLVPGTVVWLLDAFVAGSSILPTSYAIHLGGTAAAAYAVRKNGHAPQGWLAALGVLAGAVLASRLALPAEANVNAAHAVPAGWDFLSVAGGSPARARASFAVAALALALAAAAFGDRLGRVIARSGPAMRVD